MHPRAMNNKEKSGYLILKSSGLSHEIYYDKSPYSGGFMVNVHQLKETFSLSRMEVFTKSVINYKK